MQPSRPTLLTARDPILSLFQSAASAVSRRLVGVAPPSAPLVAAAAAVIGAETGEATREATAAGAGALGCARLGLDLLRAAATADGTRLRALHDRLRFSECDPLWVETLFEYARLYLPAGTLPPVPYRRHAALTDFVIPAAAPRLRVGLLSDWGTGTGEARRVATLLAAQRPDVVIHLGDIYFSGTAEECEAHFLAPLRAAMPDARLLTLCGNHDTYSGGAGYYDLLDRIGQPASYFCLRSPDDAWQILAADTGLHDRNPFDEADTLTFLEPGEIAWHADKVRGFPGRTILLSHHQPFSGFRPIGPAAPRSAANPNLIGFHDALRAAGTVDAWFWGHEHSLRHYAPYRGIAAGRNIGFGAIPVRAGPDEYTPLAGLPDPPAVLRDLPLDVVDGAYAHGFALLDLSPDGIDASYWTLTRPEAPLARERWGAPTA